MSVRVILDTLSWSFPHDTIVMTGKEIENARRENRSNTNIEERKIIGHELDCREMANSCLIYGDNNHFYNDATHEWGRYGMDYWKKYGLTEKRVLEIWNEQKESFSHARVGHAGYDCEGVSYNYCIWGDEI